VDYPFVAENTASRERLLTFVESLTSDDLRQPLGEHWTVSIGLLHLAFWDRQWLLKFQEWERTGTVVVPAASQQPNLVAALNDGMLGWWRDVAPEQAKIEVIAGAQAIDEVAATLGPATVEAILAARPRTLFRAVHRREHLNEAATALGRDLPLPPGV
jgi:hypothetical protein